MKRFERLRVLMGVCALQVAQLLPHCVLARDWPQFRGPNGDGVSQATDVPLRWSATENIAWKQEIPGTGWSSPVLAGDKLFLTTAVDGDAGATSLRVICLNARQGKRSVER